MRKTVLSISAAGMLALTGCEGVQQRDAEMAGALFGAAGGVLTARVLDADPAWTVIATLGGAAAGAMVARHTQTGQCAFARGDGTYRVGPCP